MIPFYKYVGCGNDFILFDNRENVIHPKKEFIEGLCHRQKGIGADGVILLECSTEADFRMRIFNADGSEAEMCGNGIRCLMKFAKEMGIHKTSCFIETLSGILKASHQGEENVAVEIGEPKENKWDIKIGPHKGNFLDVGVPHFVIFSDKIETYPLDKEGPFLRYHPYFGHRGTNVNVAEIVGDRKIKIRTYERGVEGETLACGTGATAVALAAAYTLKIEGPLQIETRSGEILTIGFRINKEKFTHVTLTGSAKCTFKGVINHVC